MDKNDKTVLLKLKEKAQSNRNTILIIFVCIYVFGYLFFFTSNLWFPGSEDLVAASILGKEYGWNDRTIQIESWNYAATTHEMEIIFSVTNNKYVSDQIEYEILDKKYGYMDDVDIVCQNEELVVLHVSNINKNWQEISLRIKSSNPDVSTMRLYTNKDSVNQVSEMPQKTEQEYIAEHMQFKIGLYNDQIEDYNQSIADNEKQIQQCQDDISDLQKEKTYQTEEEQQQTDSIISQAKSKISDLESENASMQSQIEELKNRIEKLQEKLQSQ